MSQLYYVELLVQGCTAEVYLNAIPIGRAEFPQHVFVARAAAPYLISGANLLELVVAPGATPSVAREPRTRKVLPPTAKARARVCGYLEGEYVGSESGRPLAVATWPEPPGQTKEEFGGPAFPHTLSAPFQVATPPSAEPWAWQQADVINGSKDERAVGALITELHRAFAAGDPEPFMRVTGVYFQEIARCFPGLTAYARSEGFAQDIRGNVGRKNWVKPLDPANLDLRLCAGGRLVDCVTKDWAPVLDTLPQPDHEIFPLPIMIGRYKRLWQVLR